jgi:hypothetical protein
MSASDGLRWECFQALKEAVGRNGTVEVAVVSADSDDRRISYCVRLLKCTETSLVIERPRGRRLPKGPPIHSRLQITVASGGERWSIGATVVDLIDFPLSEGNKVHAAGLSLGQCCEAPRRQFFRVDVAGLGVKAVVLYPLCNGKRIPDEMPVPCVMLNFSAGGLGLAAAHDVETLSRFDEFECMFTMPGEPKAYQVKTQLTNMHQRTAITVYLGLQFVFDASAADRRLKDQVFQWAAELQRRQSERRNLKQAAQ